MGKIKAANIKEMDAASAESISSGTMVVKMTARRGGKQQ